MALQAIPGGLLYPDFFSNYINGAPGYYNLLIAAAGEKAAFIVEAPATGSITAIGWKTNTVTTGATVDVRLETVDAATGDPTGTLVGTNTNGSQVVADTDDGVWFTTALTAAASVTKGQKLAVVIVNPATPGNLNIAIYSDSNSLFPYNDLYTTAWAKGTNPPVLALSYSGVYYFVPGIFPYSSLASTTYNSGTVAQDEVALKFKVPFPCRVAGAEIWADLDGDAEVVLYDSDGSTALTPAVAIDANIRGAISPNIYKLVFTSSPTLLKNTFYYLSLKPTTTTNVVLYDFSVPSLAHMDAVAGGQNAYYSSRVDAGAWSDTPTRRPFMSVMIDAFDDGVGGGGGGSGMKVHLGMDGGMRG